MIRVAVSGSGTMGTTVVAAVEAGGEMQVVGLVEPLVEEPSGTSAVWVSASGENYPLHADPAALFAAASPDVVVDFTNAQFTPRLIDAALDAGVRPVVGTSGVTGETIDALRARCASEQRGAVVAANFALGAVMLMHLAEVASPYFDAAEIIELHHDGKVDAPSGTALETARLMREARGRDFEHPEPELTHIDGTRGGAEGGVGIHSVRLPGFVAHQEVIFGGVGQTLSLRHDSTGRDSFMPGVLLAIREVMRREELVVGLDALIGLK
ncbi:MAG TPA: 4-hydroxy-tetrahydrodipicolinate reductase [Dehalococcoidia bacterium]|nr:4-hydroxy-tetrahydrodipicolinate reductase [Dehalococcoidia bacterium]